MRSFLYCLIKTSVLCNLSCWLSTLFKICVVVVLFVYSLICGRRRRRKDKMKKKQTKKQAYVHQQEQSSTWQPHVTASPVMRRTHHKTGESSPEPCFESPRVGQIQWNHYRFGFLVVSRPASANFIRHDERSKWCIQKSRNSPETQSKNTTSFHFHRLVKFSPHYVLPRKWRVGGGGGGGGRTGGCRFASSKDGC